MIFLGNAFAKAQTTDTRFLQNISKASQTEIDAYPTADLEEGMLVYNTNENRIYEYTNAGFQEVLTADNVYVGHFIISADGLQTISGLPFRPTAIDFSARTNIESESINATGSAGSGDNINNNFGTMNGYALDTNGVITQQIIYVGGSGASINDISRYANPLQCIGIRYTNADGEDEGKTTATLTTMTADGFTINVTNRDDNLLVLYTAYR